MASQRQAEIDDVRAVVRRVTDAEENIQQRPARVVVQYANRHNADLHSGRTVDDRPRDMGAVSVSVLRNVVSVDKIVSGNQTVFQERMACVDTGIYYRDGNGTVDFPFQETFGICADSRFIYAP